MLALWLATVATAATPGVPLVAGERLDWAISWMGLNAGAAWSTTSGSSAGWVFEAGAKSATWLASMYPIDDLLRSEWVPGVGSSRHVTRFREGRFEQDQDMRFLADAVVVGRTQRFDEGPRTWEDRYAAAPRAEDPVSAFYRLREEAGPVDERVRYQVWTGRKSIPMVVWTAAVELYEGQSAFRVEVLTDHGNEDVEPKMTVWITDDAARVPLAAVVRSRAGPVKASLVKRTVP
ncbi:MAG: DUF3108 domain-containing protein [Pseudomonadota bacterium]|nr:DUF3108 domain-containing protein [Pseudomonadota bacterium]